MSSDTQADELLRALGKEVIKVYRVYDGSDRLVTQYEALANAIDNQPCLKTTYEYDGATTRVAKMLEELDVWSAAYDI